MIANPYQTSCGQVSEAIIRSERRGSTQKQQCTSKLFVREVNICKKEFILRSAIRQAQKLVSKEDGGGQKVFAEAILDKLPQISCIHGSPRSSDQKVWIGDMCATINPQLCMEILVKV